MKQYVKRPRMYHAIQWNGIDYYDLYSYGVHFRVEGMYPEILLQGQEWKTIHTGDFILFNNDGAYNLMTESDFRKEYDEYASPNS